MRLILIGASYSSRKHSSTETTASFPSPQLTILTFLQLFHTVTARERKWLNTHTNKLTHFNTRFLAEPIRFIFAYANVNFEDNRIPTDEWRNMKDQAPWSQLPMLELPDGRVLGQSSTICEYLGKKFDLVGNDELDEAKCHEVSDALRDMRQEWRKVFFQKNRDRKAVATRQFLEETVPKYFERLNQMQEESGGPFLICDRITYADILFAHNAAFFEETVKGDIFAKYPKLKELKEKVHAIPRIKEYTEVRTKTDTQMLHLIPISV